MDEYHVLSLLEVSLSYQINQPRHALAGINWVEENGFGLSQHRHAESETGVCQFEYEGQYCDGAEPIPGIGNGLRQPEIAVRAVDSQELYIRNRR